MNGFHIVDARDPVSPIEHRYEIVQGRDGPRHPVTVRFAPHVVEQVSAEGGRALAADRQFWMRQGGLALAHYVWAQAGPPPDGHSKSIGSPANCCGRERGRALTPVGDDGHLHVRSQRTMRWTRRGAEGSKAAGAVPEHEDLGGAVAPGEADEGVRDVVPCRIHVSMRSPRAKLSRRSRASRASSSARRARASVRCGPRSSPPWWSATRRPQRISTALRGAARSGHVRSRAPPPRRRPTPTPRPPAGFEACALYASPVRGRDQRRLLEEVLQREAARSGGYAARARRLRSACGARSTITTSSACDAPSPARSRARARRCSARSDRSGSQVLHVHRVSTSMPAWAACTSHSACRARPRGVGVRELSTTAERGRRASNVGVQVLERRARYRSCGWESSQAFGQRHRVAASVGLGSRPRCRRRLAQGAGFSRLEGLADAGGVAEKDLQAAAAGRRGIRHGQCGNTRTSRPSASSIRRSSRLPVSADRQVRRRLWPT